MTLPLGTQQPAPGEAGTSEGGEGIYFACSSWGGSTWGCLQMLWMLLLLLQPQRWGFPSRFFLSVPVVPSSEGACPSRAAPWGRSAPVAQAGQGWGWQRQPQMLGGGGRAAVLPLQPSKERGRGAGQAAGAGSEPGAGLGAGAGRWRLQMSM